MAVGGLLLVILVLNVMPTKAQYNSVRNAFYCENVAAHLFQCKDYPGKIKIVNVDFPEKNDKVCGNGIVHKKCLASDDDKRDLTSVLGRKCNGKRVCSIHLSHGVYKGMHLPCRNLNISILIEIFFDCIYAPKIAETTGKPSTTESSTVSMSTLPSSTLTSTTLTRTTVGASTTGETTTTVAPTAETVWTRRRPKTCNLTENIDEDDSQFLSSAPCVIFSFSCLVAQVLYLFTFLP